MYGFTHPSLIYLLEQLPGAHRCHLYDFKYHRDHVASAADEDDDVSMSLCAVCLLFTGFKLGKNTRERHSTVWRSPSLKEFFFPWELAFQARKIVFSIINELVNLNLFNIVAWLKIQRGPLQKWKGPTDFYSGPGELTVSSTLKLHFNPWFACGTFQSTNVYNQSTMAACWLGEALEYRTFCQVLFRSDAEISFPVKSINKPAGVCVCVFVGWHGREWVRLLSCGAFHMPQAVRNVLVLVVTLPCETGVRPECYSHRQRTYK